MFTGDATNFRESIYSVAGKNFIFTGELLTLKYYGKRG